MMTRSVHNFRAQVADNLTRHEPRQFFISREWRDLFDERTRHVRKLVVGHQEHSFDTRIELAIGKRHGELGFHVGERPHATNDYAGFALPNEMHSEASEHFHAYIREVPSRASDQLNSLVTREERTFLDVRADTNDQFVHESATPLDDIQMTQSDRIEGTRVNSASRHVC